MHHSNWSRASWTVTYINRNWRWLLAIVFLLCGFVGFMSGVGATERDLDNANPFTLLYYSMGLFILGGMDLGVPVGGPLWGRTLTWIAYFGAPLLTTSALVEWLQVIVANPSRWLRYLRAMEHSDVVQLTHTFNSYHLAAQHMVRSVMMEHFRETEQLDTVVIAGFGRFGQTVLEELHEIAMSELDAIAIIDTDAHRRMMVAEEQVEMHTGVEKHIFQGEIGHPEVWQQLEEKVDLSVGIPLIMMATGQDDENLRASIWLSKRHPNSKVMIRSQRESHFADSVSQSAGIHTFSLQQVFQDSLPEDWFIQPDSPG